MNAPAANPFTGLKAALAGLLSGGLFGLLMHVLFARRLAAALAALEALFARWQAGDLPPLALRPIATPRRPAAATAASARPACARRRRPAPARKPAATSAAVAAIPAFAPAHFAAVDLPAQQPTAKPRHARCTKIVPTDGRRCTPNLLR